jgi:2,5-furandicarboxylate decarboxylase 1
MAFEDLGGYLAALEQRGDLARVSASVSPHNELGLICKRLMDVRGPTTVFEAVAGSPFPIAANLFPTRERAAFALGIKEEELLSHWLECLERPVAPEMQSSGPCQEVAISTPDLMKELPAIHWHPMDGGPYITLGLVITKDPESRIRNMGIYRLQMKGENRLGFNSNPPQHAGVSFAKAEARGEPLEVAVAIGADPAIYIASQAVGSYELDELDIAGAFRGSPVPMVKCQTVDLEVPATAEIVLEGKVIPGEREIEGPFGEFTGYYSGAAPKPILEINRMTRRSNAIYVGSYEGKPPTNTHIIHAMAREPIFFAEIRRTICPTIKDLVFTEGGAASLHVVVSIKQLRRGQAKNVGFELLKSNLIKHVVVVDDDIDIHKPAEVEWAIATRVQSARDVIIAPQMAGMGLDPSQYDFPSAVSDKMVIDATRKGEYRENLVTYPPEMEAALRDRWSSLGIGAFDA